MLAEGRLETFGLAWPSLACTRGIAVHGLEVQRSDICCTSVVSRVRGSLLASLKKLGSRTANAGYAWPAVGGTAPFVTAAKDMRTVAATGHADGCVRLWYLSPAGNLDLLCLVTPPPIAGVASEGSSVQQVDMCSETGQLCVGYSDGTVVLFNFATTGRVVTPKRVTGSMRVPSAPGGGSGLGMSPPASSGASAPATPATPAVDPNMITPKKISQITQMGFTPEQAEKALATSGGDVNMATANLFCDDIDDGGGSVGGGGGGGAASAATAGGARAPSFSLGGGDALVEESVADSPPEQASTPPAAASRGAGPASPAAATSYKARAGYQCALVATCLTQHSSSGGAGDGPQQQLTAMKVCPAWDGIGFGTEAGVCIITGVLTASPQARAYSISQLRGLKAAEFRGGVNSLVQLQPCDEAATVVAFGPANIGGVPSRALWLGTSSGATYAVAMDVDPATGAPCAADPVPHSSGQAVTAINFLTHPDGGVWIAEPPSPPLTPTSAVTTPNPFPNTGGSARVPSAPLTAPDATTLPPAQTSAAPPSSLPPTSSEFAQFRDMIAGTVNVANLERIGSQIKEATSGADGQGGASVMSPSEIAELRNLYGERLNAMGPAAASAGTVVPIGTKILLRNVRSNFFLAVPNQEAAHASQCDTAAVTSQFVWEQGPVGTVLLRSANCGRYIYISPTSQSATDAASLSSEPDEGCQFVVETSPAGLLFKSVRAGLYLHVSAEAMEKHDCPVLWFSANEGSQFVLSVAPDGVPPTPEAAKPGRPERPKRPSSSGSGRSLPPTPTPPPPATAAPVRSSSGSPRNSQGLTATATPPPSSSPAPAPTPTPERPSPVALSLPRAAHADLPDPSKMGVILSAGCGTSMYVNGSRKRKCPLTKVPVVHARAMTTAAGAAVLIAVSEDGMACVYRASNLSSITQAKVFSKGGFRVANAVSSDGAGLLLTISRENRVALSHLMPEDETPAAVQAAAVAKATAEAKAHAAAAKVSGPCTGATRLPKPAWMVPMHTPGLAVPGIPIKRKAGGMMAMFSKKEVAAKNEEDRKALLGKTLDDREATSYLTRTTGAGGINPTFEKLRLKMEERTERISEIEERSAQMAQNGEAFGKAAGDLASFYKNKKWWEF